MKPIKVTFNFNGNQVTAGGKVWDSLFIDRMFITVEDDEYNEVILNKHDFTLVKEMAEEYILDKYYNSEVEF